MDLLVKLATVIYTRSHSFLNRLEKLLIVYHETDVPKAGQNNDAVSEIENQFLNSEESKNQPAEFGILFSLRTL
jgi:hypothetical protein